MKKRKSILDKAISCLKKEPVPPGPPQETVDATIAKLTEASQQPNTANLESRIRIMERIKASTSYTKVAAAVLLIAVAYATGRLSSPRPPDLEELQAALEPAIRLNLLDEMSRRWQLAWANSYLQLKEELSEQRRRDLDTYAVQTLAASNAVTNRLLEELIESINATQVQDYRKIAEALYKIEMNRLQDKAQLGNALATFAVQTEDELNRTKQDVVQLLDYTQLGRLGPNVYESPNIPEERSEE
jgi:hypothetical protein